MPSGGSGKGGGKSDKDGKKQYNPETLGWYKQQIAELQEKQQAADEQHAMQLQKQISLLKTQLAMREALIESENKPLKHTGPMPWEKQRILKDGSKDGPKLNLPLKFDPGELGARVARDQGADGEDVSRGGVLQESLQRPERRGRRDGQSGTSGRRYGRGMARMGAKRAASYRIGHPADPVARCRATSARRGQHLRSGHRCSEVCQVHLWQRQRSLRKGCGCHFGPKTELKPAAAPAGAAKFARYISGKDREACGKAAGVILGQKRN